MRMVHLIWVAWDTKNYDFRSYYNKSRLFKRRDFFCTNFISPGTDTFYINCLADPGIAIQLFQTKFLSKPRNRPDLFFVYNVGWFRNVIESLNFLMEDTAFSVFNYSFTIPIESSIGAIK